MRRFIKNNRVLSACLVISMIIIILYMFSLGIPEWFPHAGDWFNLLFQLSVGFVINFIFYVTQVYVPQYKQSLQANKCVRDRIENIVRRMQEIFTQIGCKNDSTEMREQDFVKLLQNIDVNGRIPVINASRAYSTQIDDKMHFTLKEWMLSRIEFVESEIDRLFKYYSPYVSTELMRVLENILKSPMHQNMARSLLQMPNGISFKDCKQDIFFKPYYDLMKELQGIEKTYLD